MSWYVFKGQTVAARMVIFYLRQVFSDEWLTLFIHAVVWPDLAAFCVLHLNFQLS